jgi:hypothetical protein
LNNYSTKSSDFPGLNIGLKNHGKQLREGGSQGLRIELKSIKEGIEVPLRYESDGIKKIISILSTMIIMFDTSSIIFTTINSQNRYMRFTNVKTNNNLRNCILQKYKFRRSERRYLSRNK